MIEIVALLQTIAPVLEKTTLGQLSQVLFGMLVTPGRLTMLGLSRWTEKGGSYRTIQRFYQSVIPWPAIQWLFFRKCLLQSSDEYIIAGDEVVVSKAGKQTHGLDRFFFWAAATGDSWSLIFRSCTGECAGREILSITGQPNCQKCRRKSSQQNQSSSEKGQEKHRTEKTRSPQG